MPWVQWGGWGKTALWVEFTISYLESAQGLCLTHMLCLHGSSNPVSVANRVPIHQWKWVESIWVTIQVGGVHTGGESGLELSCKWGYSDPICLIVWLQVCFNSIQAWKLYVIGMTCTSRDCSNAPEIKRLLYPALQSGGSNVHCCLTDWSEGRSQNKRMQWSLVRTGVRKGKREVWRRSESRWWVCQSVRGTYTYTHWWGTNTGTVEPLIKATPDVRTPPLWRPLCWVPNALV